ncbi:hypothetical protein OY671_002432 [Metschnikowia pulcherrima]|nr:hypothetical protein OY671_002432 [Metschnikowia pulcherrima]
MFRPVFQASMRRSAAMATRRLSTTRQSRSTPRFALAAASGLALMASAAVFMPKSSLSNDADAQKVEAELAHAEGAVEPEKTAFEAKTQENGEQKDDSAEPASDNTETAETDAEAGSQSAAFNPETGEINWDCPCLGGMAHGPCGEEFKAAFACFVYSETEPKGIDCIAKFEAMRTCFRQHPEHYKEELYEDDEPVPSAESGEPAHANSEQAQAVGNAVGAETNATTEKAEAMGEEKKAQQADEQAFEQPPATEDISKVA